MVGITAVVAGCLNSAEETIKKTVSVEQGCKLQVENRNGSVRISSGPVKKMVIRAVKKVRAISDPSDLLDDIQVRINKEADVVRIEVEHPNGSFSKQYSVGLNIEVPRKTALKLETRNGSLLIEDVKGDIRAESRNGRISIERGGAAADLETKNGSIRVAGHFVRIKAEAANGSIDVRTEGAPAGKARAAARAASRATNGNAAGATAPKTTGTRKGSRVNLITRNGSVDLRGVVTSFKVRSKNGSVKVKLHRNSVLTTDSRAETKNGSVTFAAPRDLDCRIEAKTERGRIKSSLPLQTQTRKRAAGTLGKGGAKVRIETRRGTIRLKKL
jgi:DUF4097 and DUF4098 domain-containing protein YvlB